MPNRPNPACLGCVLAMLIVLTNKASLAESRTDGPQQPAHVEQPTIDAAMADYRRKLEEYTQARQKFDEDRGGYWKLIAEKRRTRNAKRRSKESIQLDDYVLMQPPIYLGPERPVDPSIVSQEAVAPLRPHVPVVADFLKSSSGAFQLRASETRKRNRI